MAKVNGQKERMMKDAHLKEIISKAKRKDMENSDGQVETSIEVSTKKMKGMGMEKCFGQMAVAIKEAGLTESSMDKE